MHRKLRVYIAVYCLSRLIYLRKVYLESSECVKGEATKRHIDLWLQLSYEILFTQ
jgi:hypothetical protein